MNRPDHLLNGIVLGASASVLFWSPIPLVAVPIGTLVPDIDASIGRHRKTCHNVFVVAITLVIPWVWLGVATHLLLDLVSRRGIAILYPVIDIEVSFPFGISGASRWSIPVTVVVTGIEVVGLYVYISLFV